MIEKIIQFFRDAEPTDYIVLTFVALSLELVIALIVSLALHAKQ